MTTPTPRPIGTFCWAELGTDDPGGAKSFYCELFGWTAEDLDMGKAGVYSMLRLGGADLAGMYELRGPMFEGIPPHWMFYVRVADVDASYSRAQELGAKPQMGPMDIPRGRIAMFEDPVGARLALFQANDQQGCATATSATGAFGWCELNTRDPERARQFYSALFDWKMTESLASEGKYTEIGLPGTEQFGGILKMDESWGEAPPYWLGYVMVDDCDQAAARAQELGGRPIVPPMDIERVGRFAVVADPSGAVFAMIKLGGS